MKQDPPLPAFQSHILNNVRHPCFIPMLLIGASMAHRQHLTPLDAAHAYAYALLRHMTSAAKRPSLYNARIKQLEDLKSS
jgi:hypothetical protein